MCFPLTEYLGCLTLEWKRQKKHCSFPAFLLQLSTDVIHVKTGTLSPMENFVVRKLVFCYRRLYYDLSFTLVNE